MNFFDELANYDKEVFDACSLELDRQRHNIELIASENIVSKAVLLAAGSSIENAVKTTCFLADMGDFAAFNQVYGKYFTEKPARSCVAAKALPKGVLVEVEVIAEI